MTEGNRTVTVGNTNFRITIPQLPPPIAIAITICIIMGRRGGNARGKQETESPRTYREHGRGFSNS